jgi:hypothetical protein
MAGLAVSIAITEVGAPFAICTVAVVLNVAAVVCWAITDPGRSIRLTALVSAWRSLPRQSDESKVGELPPASKDAKKPKGKRPLPEPANAPSPRPRTASRAKKIPGTRAPRSWA